MKNDNFDISTVPNNGYLIFPLSMTRLSNAQSPNILYDFLNFFETKIKAISLDVIFLYTNDIYLGVEDYEVEVRRKILNQMINHKNEFLSILHEQKKYVPSAFHFLPWDYTVLNANRFYEIRNILLDAKKSNTNFLEALRYDLTNSKKEETDASINFLIEEITISHLLIQKEISLPYTLANPNGWRLICYPGNPLTSWLYAYRNRLLPKRTDIPKDQLIFSRGFYNMNKRILVDFDIMDKAENSLVR